MIYSAALFISYLSLSNSINIGDGLWRTFTHETALPLTVSDAKAQKWYQITECENGLGFLYSKTRTGPTEEHPLALRFTADGKIAGVQATVSGSNKFGDSAQKNLIDLGFWKVTKNATKTWHMDVSFRAPEAICNAKAQNTELIGDRVVINQNTIKHSIPLTSTQAVNENWTRGSCITTMGWHHFYDLKYAPKQSFQEDQILPIVPMYNPDNNSLNAFFFTVPVAQHGSGLQYLTTGAADWESPALTESGMCLNWCDETCSFETPQWATMHIYLSSNWDDLKCPNGEGSFDRSCTP